MSNADTEQKGQRVNEDPYVQEWLAVPRAQEESQGYPQRRMNDGTEQRTDLTEMENKVVLMLG